MKILLIMLLLLLGILPVRAVTPINDMDFANAALKVAYRMAIWCDCTAATDANGFQYVSNINAVYVRWTIGTTNYCSKTYGGNVFLGAMTPTTVGTLVQNAPGVLWRWETGALLPADTDARCKP